MNFVELKLEKMETIIIKTATGTLIGKMIDDDVNTILEDQRRMQESVNTKLGLAGQVEFFIN